MKLRALIVLLLCLNTGAGLWWVLHRSPAPLVVPTPAAIKRLQLVSEQARLPAAKVMAGQCFSLGPFNDQTQLSSAMRALTPASEKIQLREVPTTHLFGYRVFLPAVASREAALTRTQQLTQRGVRDFYLVSAGPQQNSISLGLFRDLENAERRRDELKALGIPVRLEPRSEQGQQWWIDFIIAGDNSPEKLIPANLDAEINLEKQSCPGVIAPADTSEIVPESPLPAATTNSEPAKTNPPPSPSPQPTR